MACLHSEILLIIFEEVFAGKWGNMDETQEHQAKVISTDRNQKPAARSRDSVYERGRVDHKVAQLERSSFSQTY